MLGARRQARHPRRSSSARYPVWRRGGPSSHGRTASSRQRRTSLRVARFRAGHRRRRRGPKSAPARTRGRIIAHDSTLCCRSRARFVSDVTGLRSGSCGPGKGAPGRDSSAAVFKEAWTIRRPRALRSRRWNVTNTNLELKLPARRRRTSDPDKRICLTRRLSTSGPADNDAVCGGLALRKFSRRTSST